MGHEALDEVRHEVWNAARRNGQKAVAKDLKGGPVLAVTAIRSGERARRLAHSVGHALALKGDAPLVWRRPGREEPPDLRAAGPRNLRFIGNRQAC